MSDTQMFEDYRKVYDFGRAWSYDSYSSQTRSLREIRRDMHKQREWRNELEKMKISNVGPGREGGGEGGAGLGWHLCRGPWKQGGRAWEGRAGGR